jgi:cobalamin biosynthesis Mg chelatase CobN
MIHSSNLNQFAQSNASDFQQSRNDLQPTGNSPQQVGNSSGATSSLSQDQLLGNQLRVGDSTTTVQNTTSNAPGHPAGHMSSAWVWLLPVLIFLVVIWIVRRQKSAPVSVVETPTTKAVESPDLIEAKNKAAKKKTKPTAKRKTRK